MRWTYLLIDVLTVLFPFAFSFHPGIRFYRCWRLYLPALFLSALIFLLADIYFTRLGVWTFNRSYTLGYYLGGLPMEEWLFFFCIPYACVFTAQCRRLAGGRGPGPKTTKAITAAMILILVTLAACHLQRRYTSVTCLSLSLLLVYVAFIARSNWLGRFYISWLLLLIPTLLVDGILTGTSLRSPIVSYNPLDILGIRILTIPVEDFFYGMGMFLLNITLFDLLQKAYYGSSNHSTIFGLI